MYTTFPSADNTRAFERVLKTGSYGSSVIEVQMMLDAIREKYPSVPRADITGIYGTDTENAVSFFQNASGLVVDGKVGKNTYDTLVEAYRHVTNPLPYPGTLLREGSSGSDVALVQSMLNGLSASLFTSIPTVREDGRYGPATAEAVRIFQLLNGLSSDGIVGPSTWDTLVGVSLSGNTGYTNDIRVAPDAPVLRQGSRGDRVRVLQGLLGTVMQKSGLGSPITVDGVYGGATRSLVSRFQSHFGLSPDGITGSGTWSMLETVFNAFT